MSGKSLDVFFAQWIRRKGGPTLALAEVSTEKSRPFVKVKGTILQQPPFYDLELEILLETEGSRMVKAVFASGKETAFEFFAKEAPVGLRADPGVKVFRKLDMAEIPPTVNSLKASEFMVAAIGGDGSEGLRSTAVFLMKSLGIDRFKIVDEKAMEAKRFPDADVLWVGLPSDIDLFASLPDTAVLAPGSFRLNGFLYDSSEDVFFGVFPRAGIEDRVTGLFLPMSESAIGTAARKVTHYGKYSYLAFTEGRNRDKGTWRVEDSPLIYRFGQD
jgi:hypothetical protein